MTRLTSIFAAIFLSLCASATLAASELDYRLDTATQVLNDLQRIPENAIPPALLNRAYAVAVIPSVTKGGFIVGGSYGRGIIVARRAEGTWSNPAFVRLIEGSVGFQAGLQSTDLILVFKSQRALDGLSRGKITLGADASIAAGPVGRQATAATDLQMQSEIYSYARSRGFFAGVSLQGGSLAMDRKANGAYYQGESSPSKILTDPTIPAPVSGRRFVETLAGMTPALKGQQGSLAAAPPPRDAEMAMPPPEGARTYGINDGAAPVPEGPF